MKKDPAKIREQIQALEEQLQAAEEARIAKQMQRITKAARASGLAHRDVTQKDLERFFGQLVQRLDSVSPSPASSAQPASGGGES